jgi:hypothetical protein
MTNPTPTRSMDAAIQEVLALTRRASAEALTWGYVMDQIRAIARQHRVDAEELDAKAVATSLHLDPTDIFNRDDFNDAVNARRRRAN